MDILQHVHEAKRRDDLVNRLTEIRRLPASGGGGRVWVCGLSTDEVEWQVTMIDKYGVDSSKWSKDEVEKRDAARKVENQKRFSLGTSTRFCL